MSITCRIAGPVVSWHAVIVRDGNPLAHCCAACGADPWERCKRCPGYGFHAVREIAAERSPVVGEERMFPAEAFYTLGPWRMMGELARARRAA